MNRTAPLVLRSADLEEKGGLRERLSDIVESRIASGEWLPGQAIPSEGDFARVLGASRMTVHNALRDLASRGLVIRRKGSGTFVAPPGRYGVCYDHVDIIDEIRAHGGTHSARVLSREIRSATADEMRAGFSAGQIFHALVLHLENDRPLELEDRLIDPKSLPDCMEIDLSQRSLFAALMLVRPHRQGEEDVRAELVDEDLASILAVPVASACLVTRRRTWTAYGAVTAAKLSRAGMRAVKRGAIVPIANHTSPQTA